MTTYLKKAPLLQRSSPYYMQRIGTILNERMLKLYKIVCILPYWHDTAIIFHLLYFYMVNQESNPSWVNTLPNLYHRGTYTTYMYSLDDCDIVNMLD